MSGNDSSTPGPAASETETEAVGPSASESVPPNESSSASGAERHDLRNRLLWGLLIAAGVAFVVSAGIQEARRAVPVKEGASAPAFSLEKYGGGTLSLTDLRGKVVMLDFWATWCPPCRAEMPDLVALARKYEDKGLVFVAASQDDPQSAKVDVGLFIHQDKKLNGLGSNVVFANDTVSDAYKIQVLPTMYFIGRDGKLLEGYTSYASKSVIEGRIQRALAASSRS